MKKEYIKILYNDLGLCNCTEDKFFIATLIKYLTWAKADIKTRVSFDKFILDQGSFYIIIGILTDLNFIEHGCSIRYSWITQEGKEFLIWLKQLPDNFQDNLEGDI